MAKMNEDAFEGAVEIVSACMEEADVEISAAGGERVGVFFAAIYRKLAAIADGLEEPGKPGSFEVYQDAKGEYRFRLKAANGETIAVSEGYEQKDSCLKGIESIKKNAAAARTKEL